MREYELTFIVQPNIDEEGVTGLVDQVSKFVETGNGQVASVNVWGRKKLAYMLDDYREGTYVLIQAQLPPSSVLELERNLKLSEDIIRYLLIKTEN